jgi:hypothetical protein
MKPSVLIQMFIIGLLSLAASALTVGSAGAKDEKAIHVTPELGVSDTFRSDSSLRFMNKIHARHTASAAATANEAEAMQSKLCLQHGFKAADRASCVAFMRKACHHRAGSAARSSVALDACTHFFHQKQPGTTGADGNQKHTKLSANKQKSDDSQLPDIEVPSNMRPLQKGPHYDSKKAQEAAEGVADENKDQGPNGDGVLDHAHKAITDIANGPGDIVDGASDTQQQQHDAFKDAQEDHEGASKESEEEEKEKDVASDTSSCKDHPKGWKDSKGNDCEDYAEGEWCNRHGGYGDAWLDDWGTFEDRATDGTSAKQACCACGGGGTGPEYAVVGGAPAGAPAPAPAQSPAAAAPWAPSAPGPAILGGKTGRELQSQGYSGELVEHEDLVTMTDDWGREFGPHAGHRDIKSICEHHPGNEWCELHGYYDKDRSGSSVKSFIAVSMALAFFYLM